MGIFGINIFNAYYKIIKIKSENYIPNKININV